MYTLVLLGLICSNGKISLFVLVSSLYITNAISTLSPKWIAHILNIVKINEFDASEL